MARVGPTVCAAGWEGLVGQSGSHCVLQAGRGLVGQSGSHCVCCRLGGPSRPEWAPLRVLQVRGCTSLAGCRRCRIARSRGS